jgi:predicted TIM-barrel fold metal-dependent hydrolase
VAATYTRGEGDERSDIGLSLLTFARDSKGKWRIASETMKFPGPAPYKPLGADDLVKLLDQADVRRAVVMSAAYFFESPLLPRQSNAAAMVRAENDWTAAQVARHPDRLIAFCGINPLTALALEELRRCKSELRMTGLKLHFGNSNVDLEKPEHLARLRQVFTTANALGMPIAAHLWTGSKKYGRKDAELVLTQLLPAAPNVVVQIMHMAGGGPGWTDEALAVFAEAVAARDPRTRYLYFDVATVADLQSPAQLQLLAKRIRQIGVERILYGSDAAIGGRNTPDQEWGTFRGMVPLTDAEFATIRQNAAPYLR